MQPLIYPRQPLFQQGDLVSAEKSYLKAIKKYPAFRRAYKILDLYISKVVIMYLQLIPFRNPWNWV